MYLVLVIWLKSRLKSRCALFLLFNRTTKISQQQELESQQLQSWRWYRLLVHIFSLTVVTSKPSVLSISIFSKSQKSINTKIYKIEKKGLWTQMDSWLITAWWASGWRGRGKNCQFQENHSPFKINIIIKLFRFLKSRWNFQKAARTTACSSDLQTHFLLPNFQNHTYLAKSFAFVLRQGQKKQELPL